MSPEFNSPDVRVSNGLTTLNLNFRLPGHHCDVHINVFAESRERRTGQGSPLELRLRVKNILKKSVTLSLLLGTLDKLGPVGGGLNGLPVSTEYR